MKKLALLMALFATAGFIGCSSSSDGGPSYTGSTAKAVVDEGNGLDFAEATTYALKMLFDEEGLPLLPINESPSRIAAAGSTQQSYEGDCGGTLDYSYTEDYDPDTGSLFEQTIVVADSYCSEVDYPTTDGNILSGKAVSTYDRVVPAAPRSAELVIVGTTQEQTYSFTNWSIITPASISESSEDETMVFNGTQSRSNIAPDTFDSYMVNIFIKYIEGEAAPLVAKFDLTGTFYYSSGLHSAEGEIYFDDQGYLTLSTHEDYKVNYVPPSYDPLFSSGGVTLEGDNGSKLRMDFISYPFYGYDLSLWDQTIGETGDWGPDTYFDLDWEVIQLPVKM